VLNFCTLFNSVYLTRGLAMYYSLVKHCKDFHLYIFAFDDLALQELRSLDLQHATIIALEDFEDEELLSVKPDRTPGEYCWTATPATITYCLDQYQLTSCTYIDADLLFFSDPIVLLKEMKSDDSVMITDHRYTPEYDQTKTSGKYCVQFVYFKNDINGRKVLDWWKAACIEWCYNRFEDNKFGDQKYLDDWCSRFEGVRELAHLGGGVAPWNVQQYNFTAENNRITGKAKNTSKSFDLIFYHFHHLKYCEKKAFYLGPYKLTKDDINYIYKPYIKALYEAKDKLQIVAGAQAFHETIEIPRIRKSLKRMFYLYILGHFNNYYTSGYLIK
jgi:hypothetical protein